MAHKSLIHLSSYLMNGYWIQSGYSPFKWNLTDTGPSAQYGILTYNLGSNLFDGNGISSARKELVRDAFTYLENVTGINFVEVPYYSSANIMFSDRPEGAYSQVFDANDDGVVDRGHVNVSASWSNFSNSENNYVIQTILHEIGHVLGLGHMGLYNGSGNYQTDARFFNDSWQNSIMSYFSQTENTRIDADFAYLQTFMAADLYALNRMYSSQSYDGKVFGTSNAFKGDTTYGFNSTISESDDPILSRMWKYGDTNAYTIVDGGGVDTLDFSGWSDNQFINLTIAKASQATATLSNIGGLKGNLAIGLGTIIENATGGDGHDKILGNEKNNVLIGNGGNDILYEKLGNDTIYGMNGGDQVYVDKGNDYLDGGGGFDWLMLRGDNRTVVDLNVHTAQNTGFGFDTIVGFELISGGKFRDTLTGTDGVNILHGNGGHDIIYGNGGNDKLTGGAHNDIIFGGSDNDRIEGGTQNDRLFGNDGNDVILGQGGADIIDGGLGQDQLFAGIDHERDVIIFRSIDDSAVGSERDQVHQFDSGEDDIHLWQIDSNENIAGNQKFLFSKNGAQANSVWIDDFGNSSLVRADVDGDAAHDFEILIVGVNTLHGYDFIL